MPKVVALLVFLLLPVSPPAVPQNQRGSYDIDIRSAREQLDEHANNVSRAVGEGLAIVIVPVFDDEDSTRPTSGFSRATNWRNLDQPGSPIVTEAMDSFRIGKSPYAFDVMLVSPGRYSLQGVFNRRGEQHMQQSRLKPATPSKNGLGTIHFQNSYFMGARSTTAWSPPQFVKKNVESVQCTMVIAGTNTCVGTAYSRQAVDVMVDPGGYRPRYVPQVKNTVDIFAEVNQPFAEFEVGAGEIVLVDMIFAKLPNVRFDENRCGAIESGSGEWCELTEFQMQRIPASIEQLRGILDKPLSRRQLSQGMILVPWAPFVPHKKLADALSSVQYRKMRMSAKAVGTNDPAWGQTYTLKDHAAD